MNDSMNAVRSEQDSVLLRRLFPSEGQTQPFHYAQDGESCDLHAHVNGFGVVGGVLAAMYVPVQRFDHLYDMETAWRRGTLFEELDKPFYGSGKEGGCRGYEK